MHQYLHIIILLTFWLPFASLSLAAGADLVSRMPDNSPGQADSGSIRGGSEMRAAAVLDNGTAFFVSIAQLAPADTNMVADYYSRTAAGTVTAIDLPSEFTAGHFFWGWPDAIGTSFYLFRQFPDPSQFELLFETPAGKSSLGVRSLIKSADFAADSNFAVYEQDVPGGRHLFLHNLGSNPKVETWITSGHNGNSRDPAISANGNRLVFSATSSNVVPDDINGVADIFLYERTTATFTLISQRLDNIANADAVTPDISADGQTICFASADNSFVPGDTNANSDIFIYHNSTIQRCSIAADGTQADADSHSPRLNASGRFVVFVSRAGNLLPGMDNGLSQVFLFDREGARLEVLSIDGAGLPADADCFVPEISPSGRYVTFVSKATNLAAGVDGTHYQVYRADRGPHYANHPPVAPNISLAAAPGTTIHITPTATDADQDALLFVLHNLPAHGTLTDTYGTPLLSGQTYGADSFPWQFVPTTGGIFADSFEFHATDGKNPSSTATAYIRMVDPTIGHITRISIATDGTQGTRDSYLPYAGLGISADGGIVAFSSTASELDPADTDNGFADIFLRHTAAGVTSLISGGGTLNKHAYRSALAGDASAVVYYTEDGSALVLQDVAGGGRTTIATVSSYLSNSGPGISHDGTRVVYEKNSKLWMFDRKSGTTVEVSVNSQGETANASCGDVAVSANGLAVAFSSTATNLDLANPDGIKSIYLHFPDSGQTVLVSETQAGELVADAAKPALSETGYAVVFLADDGTVGDGIGTVYVKNTASGALRLVADTAANPVISADGRFVCYMQSGISGKNQLYRADLATVPETVHLVSNAGAGVEGDNDSFRAVLSASGRFVAFASNAENLVPDDTNGKSDIFLNDFGITPNELPVPTLTSITTDEDQALVNIPLTYTDTENNDVRTEIVSGPAHASQFSIQARQPGQEAATFTYVPLADYNGTDSFSYRCGDAAGWSAPVTVTITINPVYDPPRWLQLPALWGMHPGHEFRLNLRRFAFDPDAQDPATSPLYFSLLQGDPEARIEGHELIISAVGTSGPEPISLWLGVADSEDGIVVAFETELTIHVRPPLEIQFFPGWNLISLPLHPEPADPALLLTVPGTVGSERLYQGSIWFWDARTESYRSAGTTLETKRGYWVYCTAPATVSMQVVWEPAMDPAVELVTDWNLVGPVGLGEFATPVSLTSGVPLPGIDTWLWNGTGYASPAENLVPAGDGCWIRARITQTIDFELE